MQWCSAIVIALFVAPMLYSQQNGDQLGEITFEELQGQKNTSAYFGIGAGYVGGVWYFPSSDFKEHLRLPYSMHGDYPAPLFAGGISGFLTLSLVGNLRIGFEIASGSQTHTEDHEQLRHRASMSLSSTMIQLDYAFPILKSLIVAPGVYLGRGSLSFEHTSGPSAISWDNTLGVAQTSILEAPFWHVRPTFAVEYALSGYAALRAWGSYNLTLMGTWQENTLTTVNDVPNAMNARGLSAGLGIFIGLFRSE